MGFDQWTDVCQQAITTIDPMSENRVMIAQRQHCTLTGQKQTKAQMKTDRLDSYSLLSSNTICLSGVLDDMKNT